ncbi:MAG: hypothetical protein K9H26_08140 [Prolixibacteraceae bacterium]|nr:hypothetical protein [Prolixibacteraceae bacterium]
MKKRSKIFTATAAIAALAIGFLIGISVDFPKTDNTDLTGTIGKVKKYNDVQMEHADIQLRSDLLNDLQLRKRYEDYYAMQYALAVQQSENIGFAIETAKQNEDFSNNNQNTITQLEQFRKTLEETRASILLAHAAVKKINGNNATVVTEAMNNANISIAQIDYNDNAIIHFTEALARFIKSSEPPVQPDILKAHDLLTFNQLTKAVLTNDKPMVKYLDKKEIFSDHDKLNMIYSQENFNAFQANDTEKLKMIYSQENLKVLDREDLGLIIPFGDQQNLNVNESLKDIFFDINKLEAGLLNTEILNSSIVNKSDQILGTGLLNTEKLNIFMDKDFLESCMIDSEFLKEIVVWNQEQLGVYSHETLGAW